MKRYKLCFLIVLISLLCMPFTAIQAQEEITSTTSNTTETIQQDQNDNVESSENADSKEKKKDKKKNNSKDARINQSFYFNMIIDILTMLVIIGFIYFRNCHNKELLFTYFVFNIAIFLLTFLLNQVKISMGAAFGLFAVFSMLRYRTEGISVKDMTYLFIVIALGLVSAIQLEYYELGIISAILIVTAFIFDGGVFFKHESYRKIQYEKIELIKSQNYSKLILDLRERTGLNIHRVTINKMDFLKDTASLNVYYYPEKSQKRVIDSEVAISDPEC